MAVQNFDFRFTNVMPKGWTAQTLATPKPSSVGPVNAMAQNAVTAESLRTTPSTLSDSTLGSRRFKNPNTGVRDPVLSGSVYAMGDVPPYLSQAVAALNEEQSLRRALQAEWNNRLLQGAASPSPNAFLFAEALRAASVSPGASVAFGQRIADPQVGRASVMAAETQSRLESDRKKAFDELERVRSDIARLESARSSNTGLSFSFQPSNELAKLRERAAQLQPAASYVGRTGSVGGWTPSRPPVNSFQPGYKAYWG